MPRPVDEFRFRRFMMQGIMWLILGATVGIAALVNQSKQRSMKVVLDAPRSFDGFSIRLPLGWDGSDFPPDERGSLTIKDPDANDVMLISTTSSWSNLKSAFGGSGSGVPVGDIPIAGRKRTLMLYRIRAEDDEIPANRLRVSCPLDSGKTLTIDLITFATVRRTDFSPIAHEIDLIKQVAASVQIDAGPATQPQE